MPEGNGRSFTEGNEPHEIDNGATTASRPESKSAAADSARMTALKARKRTKTGCLSKSFQMDWSEFQLAHDFQHVASAESSAVRNGQHAKIAQSPSATAKDISLDFNSRTLLMPSVLISQASLRALNKYPITMVPNTFTGACLLQWIHHSPHSSFTESRTVVDRILTRADRMRRRGSTGTVTFHLVIT